jgi:hypothetical protein
MSEEKGTMTAQEFELAIDELVKGMTAFHNRLLRIEKWMLKQEELKKKQRSSLITNVRQR